MRRGLILGLILFGLFVGAFTIRSARMGPPPLPVPNGYEKFIEAGDRVKPIENPEELTTADLRELIEREAGTLKLLREGLSLRSLVPLQNNMQYIEQHLAELRQLKRLAHLLKAEARLAEVEERPLQAAGIYLEVIRFGHEFSRGGLMVDRLMGIACETIGLSGLSKLSAKLSAEERQKIAVDMKVIDANSESAQEVLRAERRWARAAGGFSTAMVRIFRPGLLRGAENKFLAKVQKIEAERQKTIELLRNPRD